MTAPDQPIHSAVPRGPTSRPAFLVVGIVLALLGLPMLLGGLGMGWALLTQRDDDGFFTTPTARFSTQTAALTSPVLRLGEAGPDDWWVGRDLATVRLQATSAGGAVFVGVAPSSEVERYLQATSHDEINDVRTDPFDYSLTRRGGTGTSVSPPADQSFWTAQAVGTGQQQLEWDVRPGSYAVVVMNADGSPGVTVDLLAGGRLGMLTPIAWLLGVVGTALIVGGALLVIRGAHRPDAPTAPVAPTRPGAVDRPAGSPAVDPLVAPLSPVRLTGHQSAQLSRWLWLVKWLLAIPHVLALMVLWLVFVVLTVVAFVAILVTGRYPRGLFDLNVGVLRWTWRVQFYASSAIGTDRYPPFTLDHAAYPADLSVEYPQRLSRGLVLVKSWLLALPHLIVIAVLAGSWRFGEDDRSGFAISGLIGALTLAAGLLLLFTGRYPAPLFDLLIGLNRWVYRVIAYIALMTDSYPPFRLDQGPTEPDGSQPTPPVPPAPATGQQDPASMSGRTR